MPPSSRRNKAPSSRAARRRNDESGAGLAARRQKRLLQLARENDISVDEVAEVTEAFRLFSRPLPKARRKRGRPSLENDTEDANNNDDYDEDDDDDNDDDDDDGDGDGDYQDDNEDDDGDDEVKRGEEEVIPIGDVRRALIALDLPPESPSELNDILTTLDPDKSGVVHYEPFVAVCALKLELRKSSSSQPPPQPATAKRRRQSGKKALAIEEGQPDEGTAAEQAAEIEAAYRLFTGGGPGPITVAHLRRVARDLNLAKDTSIPTNGSRVSRPSKKEAAAAATASVDEEMLRRMILEANGGAGVARGVRLEDFKNVMARAGVF